jgi:hypothetical protein
MTWQLKHRSLSKEQILTYVPNEVPDHVRIQPPTNRTLSDGWLCRRRPGDRLRRSRRIMSVKGGADAGATGR